MERKFDKDSEEWRMFRDYWKLCQMVWEVEESDSYWTEVADRVEEFRKVYKSEFAGGLVQSLLGELERKSGWRD